MEQARGTQDHKPSALQVEFVEALKEYKVSVIDYVFKILGILYGIVLFIIAIATLTNKKWTVLAVNLVVSYTLVVELIENAIFTFIKPLPSPITIHLAYNQKIFLYVQNFIPVLAIALLILWYFNRIQIIKFLKSN